MSNVRTSKANGLFDFTMDWEAGDLHWASRPLFRHSVRASRDGFLQVNNHRITKLEMKQMIQALQDALEYIERKPNRDEQF